MRTATTAEPIAYAILELEALLRPAVFTSIWGPSSQVQPRPAGAPARKGPAGQKPTPKPGKALATAVSKSGRLNRAASAASGKANVLPIMYNKHGEMNTKKVVVFKFGAFLLSCSLLCPVCCLVLFLLPCALPGGHTKCPSCTFNFECLGCAVWLKPNQTL